MAVIISHAPHHPARLSDKPIPRSPSQSQSLVRCSSGSVMGISCRYFGYAPAWVFYFVISPPFSYWNFLFYLYHFPNNLPAPFCVIPYVSIYLQGGIFPPAPC